MEPYKPFELVDKMHDENMLASKVSIDFGGGEPTILPDFAKYLRIADKNGWNMTISTSGILFSDYICQGLKQGFYSVHISPDAGTKETYYKIKGQCAFEKVWKNINGYCKTSEAVFVRYILFSMNSSKEEIDAFIDQCMKNHVKNVVISAEHEAVRGINDRIQWVYGEDEYKANAYMVKECVKHGFATHMYLSGMSKETENRVLTQFVDTGIRELVDNGKLFVFGIGKNGKQLIEQLVAAGAVVSGFVDNYAKVECNQYCGVPRVQYNDIDKERDAILISPANYKEIEKILDDLGYKNVYKLYLE